MRFIIRSSYFFCGVLCLTGCATSSPEEFHRLQTPPIPQPVIHVPLPYHPIMEASQTSSGYRQWKPPSQAQLSQIRHSDHQQYVKQSWPSLKKSDKQTVMQCVKQTEDHFSGNGQAQWVYVSGVGYQKKYQNIHHAPACWSSLSQRFHQDKAAIAQNVGESNPLVIYESSLAHWADFCHRVVTSKKGLDTCLNSSWIQTIQSDKLDVKLYIDNQGD